MTGDDDPDDRRTYPVGRPGRHARHGAARATTQTLATLRADTSRRSTDGDFRVLLADDADGDGGLRPQDRRPGGGRRRSTAATRRRPSRSRSPATCRTASRFTAAYGVGNGGAPARHRRRRASRGDARPDERRGCCWPSDGRPDAARRARRPARDRAKATAQVSLAWDAVAGAAGYNVYRSPVSGGGYVKVNGAPVTGTTFTDHRPAQRADRTSTSSRALDAAGNESALLQRGQRRCRTCTIGWANLQWPPTLTHTISAVNRTDNVYGQVWIDGVTNQPGATPEPARAARLRPRRPQPGRQRRPGPGSTPSFNVDAGNNDEFVASLLPEAVGDVRLRLSLHARPTAATGSTPT